ncbi:MAG: autotransporter domain-containing protein [Shinella sp.]|nr:autotransporter domain-containing protein [Shinella sp.]
MKGGYDAATTQIFGEMAYGFDVGDARLEPFANLAYVNLRTDGFAEDGGVAALSGSSAGTNATFSTFGLRASTSLDVSNGILTAHGTLGWRHAYGDQTPDATVRLAGGEAFSISGVPIIRDAAVVETGIEYAISQSTKLDVTVAGQFGSGTSSQSVKVSLDMKF